MGKFGDDVLKFRLKVEDRMNVKFRKVVLDLDRAVVQGGVGAAPGTPVDKGHARGNWQANIGPQPSAVEKDVTDKDGGPTIAAAEQVLNNLKIGDTVWLSNAVPYIRVLEYGDYPNPPKKITGRSESGFSSQAVGGFVSVAAAEFANIVEEAG